MATPVHVTVATNECGGVGLAAIERTIRDGLDSLPMEIDLKVDAVVFTRITGAVLPAAHAGDVKKLEAIQEFARELRGGRAIGPGGLASQMIASHLLEILRGEI